VFSVKGMYYQIYDRTSGWGLTYGRRISILTDDNDHDYDTILIAKPLHDTICAELNDKIYKEMV